MRRASKRVLYQFFIDSETRHALKYRAADLNTSVAAIVRRAVDAFLANQQRHLKTSIQERKR